VTATSRLILIGLRSVFVGALISKLWTAAGWPLALIATLAFLAHLLIEADTAERARR
jgi:hypothetical protein